MNKKVRNNLYLTIGSLCTVIVLVAITIAVVIASVSQTLTTSIRVTYKAIDIDGAVSASYTFAGTTTAMTTADGTEKFVFDAEDEQNDDVDGTLSMPAEGVQLTSQNNEILITYTFENYGDAVYTALMNVDEETLEKENIKVEYSKDNLTYRELQYALLVENGVETKYYIRISVEDLAKNAVYDASFVWDLSNYVNNDPVSVSSFKAMDFTTGDNGTTYTANYIGGELIDGTLVVPTEIAGTPVTAVNGALADETAKERLATLKVPEGIESVTGFEGYPNLQIVEIGNNANTPSTFAKNTAEVTPSIEIEENAFKNCFNLTEIYLGPEVKTIGANAFADCSCVDYIYYNCNIEGSILSNKVFFKNIGYNTDGCEVVIGKNVTKINNNLFGGSLGVYNNITSITIGDNVKSIGAKSFSSCENLLSIDIPEGVTTISSYAFQNCSNLTSIVLPSSITSIGSGAFSGCTKVSTLYYNANITSDYTKTNSLYKDLGVDVGGVEIIIGDTVSNLPAYMFYNCENVISVTFGSNLICIGVCAFTGCLGLDYVEFKETDGWYRSISKTDTSGEFVDVTDSSVIQLLTENFTNWYYYWKRNEI